MFSVVIPLYNKEKYILRAVESVLSQNFADFELIIVDDGSVDDSLEVIKSISDSRVRIIQQTNQGVGSARNKGMAEAKYDWIALLDADDAWSIDHLSELSKIISTFSSLGMVATKALKTNTNPPAIDDAKPGNIRLIDYFLEASKKRSLVCSSSVAISKKAFDNIGGFSDKKRGEDLEYWVKVALAYPVATSDKVTAYYFRGTGGITESKDESKKKRQHISSLKDISPQVNVILEKAIKNPDILKENGIRRYINRKVFNAVIAATLEENFSIAKGYAKLALPQPEPRFVFLKLYQRTPNLIFRKVKVGLALRRVKAEYSSYKTKKNG
ncbi:glycosyltransferase family 2 protein [Psychrobacter aquaticus]|uniref:Glycosyltransferase 2-like domain-containing protein n=1 Tax=Psychrobacter aquaticus CMS 56 TaxID=1354303 RepID=U4TBV4_9GAMM|nr:glycosyltransferase family A protein [Psychrobacter aquaticus]ERL56209.1 hypothetical protein M917_0887 [Psychrobacter aquaticus CMS 56]